jgi:PAS domain S-box-containing protein
VRERQILKRDLSLHEKAVDHERLLNASIIASITSGLLILDISGLIVLVNEHAQGLLRISSSKLVGRHYKVAMPRKISSAIRRIIDSATGATGRTTIKKVKINQDFLQITGFRVVKGKDESSGFLLFVQDVTEQELAAQQLYRAEKLATIGTMLSGISHELRNPLSIISARCQRALQKQTWDHDWIVAALESIQHQTHRCATIVNNLLDFTRHTATMPAYHKIGEIIEETLTYVAYHGIFNSIKVEKRYEESQEVFGDRSRIVQALLNVITNAVDAMERAGILRISARLRQPHWVIVEVNDTGPGIDPAIQDVIFDPFFTTKDPGKGTGLGLAIAQRIIEESNGEIWLMSEPGNTSFFIKLPSLREGVNARTNSAG